MSAGHQFALPFRTDNWLAAGTPLERLTRLLAIVTGFSIPLSTSFSEIATGLFMASWLCSGHLSAKWRMIRGNATALLSLAMFGALLAGMAWSAEGWQASGRCLLKYREFLYLPMFLVVFQDARLRRLGTFAYMAGAILLLGLSYFERFSGADLGLGSTNLDFVVAKDRIIHSLLMAFLVYLAAVLFVGTTGRIEEDGGAVLRWRCLYGALIALAVYNILFMVQGRTGYLLLAALTTLFLFQRLGKRGAIVACVLLGTAACGTVAFSRTIQGRVRQTLSQLENQFGPERKHSPDRRLEFYENTLKLIGRHPFIGTGTGSFRSEYKSLVAGTDDAPTSDPHNEYLHLATQVGIPGAVLFIALLAVQWLAAARLSPLERDLGRGIVLTIALGSLFNSLILSVTGGLIYSYFSGIAFAEFSSDVGATESPTLKFTEAAPSAARRAA